MPEKLFNTSIAGLPQLAAGFATPQAHSAETLTEAFSQGKASLKMRFRYEGVDDGNLTTKDADAYTLRSRLGYTSGSYNDLKAHADFEVINTGGDFNSATNGHTDYAKVVDPKGEELNQAWLSYKGISNTEIKLGRQRIIFDNARFVGNAGWRQNEQTFDAVKIANTSFTDTEITYSHISQINTITRSDVDTAHNLLNMGFAKTPVGKISAYAYLLDVDDTSGSADTDTFGARIKGAADSFYSADAFSTDTQKIWLTLEANLKQ